MAKIIAGTRRSKLARIQTKMVCEQLMELFPDLEIEEKIIVTKGDRILDAPLSKIGDKGLFTREIEQELIDGKIDFAVHSYKDLPTLLPEGLAVGAVLRRERPHDSLITPGGSSAKKLEELPPGAIVGTSSLRRIAMLLHKRSDIEIKDIRGNVNTRLDKLEAGEYDAIVLALAGVTRMNEENRVTEILKGDGWFHAVSQGAIAVEVRQFDPAVQELIGSLEHVPTRIATDAERAFLLRLEGGCQVPVGVRTDIDGDVLHLAGMVAGIVGDPFITGEKSAPAKDAAKLGTDLANELLERGAKEILDSIREQEQDK